MLRRISKDTNDLFQAIWHQMIMRGLLHGEMATPFIVVGGPRSGSTFLQTLLNSHPNVVCMHELLKETANKAVFYRHYYGRRGKLLQTRERDLEKFINEILFTPQPKNVAAIGFKALYIHPNNAGRREEAWRLLAAVPDLKVIWIDRNPLESVISFAIAKQTGSWVGKRLSKPIRLDSDYIVKRLVLEARLAKKALKYINGLSIHRVVYANLVDDFETETMEIQRFLELDYHKLETRLRKQNAKPLEQLISNMDEIYEALEGTPWDLTSEKLKAAS